jgi:NADPH-ferrihemoprotein reductase
MDEDYLAWKEEMFLEWQKAKGLQEREQVYEPSIKVIELDDGEIDAAEVYLGETKGALGERKAPFNQGNPFLAKVRETRELFNNTDRSCIHVEVDISNSGIKYMTGDHLALHAQNSNEEVDRFLSVFGLSAKRNTVIDVKALDATVKIPFPTPTTYDTICRFFLEINGPVSRQLVSSIAPFAPTEEARFKAKQLGSDKDLFAKEVTHHYLNIARLLKVISEGQSWNNVPFSFLVESLPHLSPRYYSISSSATESRDKVTITAAVERITPSGSDHVLKGVATNYVADIKKHRDGSGALDYEIRGPRGKYLQETDVLVPIHIRHSNFKLPSSPKKPIIMVGPGTGVAPFRGFIRERAHVAANGARVARSLLFFGCRKSTEDFLYEDEWKQYSAEGSPDENGLYGSNDFLKLSCAFSRDQNEKVYVQHRMLEHAKEINELLEQGANFYVCGDASHMARDVQRTLAKIISQERDLPQEKAEALVKQMKNKNQYQEDVW